MAVAQTGRTTTTEDPPTTVATTSPPTAEAPVPSVAGEETTTVEEQGDTDDPAEERLQWIIIALLVLAGLILVITIWFWRATRPARRREPLEPLLGAPASEATPAAPVETGVVADSRSADRRAPALPPGHRAPMWADEHPAPPARSSEEPR
ncbi:MAG TPA: hypothetical protein VJM33_06855 [Microthrixaceae bacterium]|nr:hypothetical protein [Microthrixaceae bacterium]